MSTPTRKLPFRKNMGYGGEKRCVICTGFLPHHHGFCDGSVGTVINEAMLQEAERIQLSSGHLVRSLAGELHACTDCGHIKCSCNSCSVCAIELSAGELYQNAAGVRFCKAHYEADAQCPPKEAKPITGVDYARGPDVTAITMARKDGSILNFETRKVSSDTRQPEWTQEGVPDHFVCTYAGTGFACLNRATWWTERLAEGRCDKHAPKVTLNSIEPVESLVAIFGKAAEKATKDLEKMARLFPLPAAKPFERPGWLLYKEGMYRHASGVAVWGRAVDDPWFFNTVQASRGIVRSGRDEAFAAAEQGIEDSQWVPAGVVWTGTPDVRVYRLLNGSMVRRHRRNWSWAAGEACVYEYADSMVEAFALAEAAQ